MATRQTIPIPLMQRWHHFRQQVLPIVCFLACCMFTLWMWQRQARFGNAVGEVQVTRVVLTAASDGFIDPRWKPSASAEYWSKFDEVREGQVVARLDDRPLQISMDQMNAELARIRSQIDADRAQFKYDHWDHLHETQRELARLTWQAFDRRLETLDRQIDVFDRNTRIATLEVEKQRVMNRIQYLGPLVKQRVRPRIELDQENLLLARLEDQIKESKIALQESEASLKLSKNQERDVDQQLGAFRKASIELPAFETLVAPLRHAITAQQKVIEGLNWQIQSLDVRTPISGMITEVHALPGQSVRAGDPIVTVASEGSQYLESYVRHHQKLQPVVGMKVKLRTRRLGSQAVESQIDRVGAAVEMVPAHQLRDPTQPEWGLPIRIPVPQSLGAQPGELIDITIPPPHAREAGHRDVQLN